MTTKVPVELSSTPGIVDGSNATAITIDSSERVGIGESSPDELLVIGGDVKIKSTNKLHFTNTSDQTSIHAPASNTMAFTTNTTERMRITSAGKVGIGSSNPQTKFVVANTDGGIGIEFSMGDPVSFIQCYNRTSNDYASLSIDGEDIRFRTNDGSERMRINSSGDVGIGTTSPQSGLHIAEGGSGSDGGSVLTLSQTGFGSIVNNDDLGSIHFGGVTSGGVGIHNAAKIMVEGDATWASNDYPTRMSFFTTADGASSATERMRIASNGQIMIARTSAVSSDIRLNMTADASVSAFGTENSGTGNNYIGIFRNSGGTLIGSIIANNGAVAFNTSSDYRLKENVDYTWDATTRLKQLKPARFNFIADETNTLVDGFLAHEVSSIVPEAITGEKDGVEMQGIDQSKLVPLLVKTIQELEARITTLEGS